MKYIVLVLFAELLFATGCANAPKIQSGSPVAKVGQDLGSAATQAFMDYMQFSAGNVNAAWAIGQAFDGYHAVINTSADVKAAVQAWTAGKGKPLADRLALLFENSSGTAQQKTAAIQAAAQQAAQSASAP